MHDFVNFYIVPLKAFLISRQTFTCLSCSFKLLFLASLFCIALLHSMRPVRAASKSNCRLCIWSWEKDCKLLSSASSFSLWECSDSAFCCTSVSFSSKCALLDERVDTCKSKVEVVNYVPSLPGTNDNSQSAANLQHCLRLDLVDRINKDLCSHAWDSAINLENYKATTLYISTYKYSHSFLACCHPLTSNLLLL